MLLIGAVPTPIMSTPRVLLVYLALALMLAGALASVLLRNLVHAIAAFTATMVSAAFLYLLIQPFTLLFAVQLLIASAIPAILMLGLLRRTSSLGRPPSNPYSRELVPALVVTAALITLLAIVVGTAAWPLKIAPDFFAGLGRTLTDTYAVAVAVSAVLVGCCALGVRLLLNQPVARRAVPAQAVGRRPKGRPVDRSEA